jgi:hypothetical protein
MPGKHPVDSLRKTAIFGTSHLIGKVLQSETCSLSGGDHSWFKRRSTGGARHVTIDDDVVVVDTIIDVMMAVDRTWR